jgi:hypothetical protein
MRRFNVGYAMLALAVAVPAAATPSAGGCEDASSCVPTPVLKRDLHAAKQIPAAPAAVVRADRPLALPQLGVGPKFGFVVELAGEVGGDPFATIEFEDGTTQDVETGRGLTVAVGGLVRPSAALPLALRGTVGFKYVTTMADNADITLTRVPIEVLGIVELPQGVWAGAGFVRHTMVKFRGGGLGPDEDLEDANGATAELGWRWVALTYTSMNYTDQTGAEYDASVFGLSFSYVFGR